MSDDSKTDPQEQARILSEALPHMQRYDEETIVIKYGGHAMGDEALARSFAQGHRAAGADRDQSGRGARRRAADRVDAQARRRAVAVRRRPAHHRRRDAGNRRDGAGRLDQQADRRLHQRRRRQGDRAVRQGRQHGGRQEGDAAASSIPAPTSRRWSISASSASPTRST